MISRLVWIRLVSWMEKWNLIVTAVAVILVSDNGAFEEASRIVKVPDNCVFTLHVVLVVPICLLDQVQEGLDLEFVWSYILYL